MEAAPSAPAAAPTYDVCFRLVLAREWEEASKAGSYAGSALDAKDGFIHMSLASEAKETARRYFAGAADLVVLVVDAAALRAASAAAAGPLRLVDEYVESRKAFFPHLYGGPLPLWAVKAALPVPLAAAGGGVEGGGASCEFVWPAEVA